MDSQWRAPIHRLADRTFYFRIIPIFEIRTGADDRLLFINKQDQVSLDSLYVFHRSGTMDEFLLLHTRYLL
jgi:hypothetical protein